MNHDGERRVNYEMLLFSNGVILFFLWTQRRNGLYQSLLSYLDYLHSAIFTGNQQRELFISKLCKNDFSKLTPFLVQPLANP